MAYFYRWQYCDMDFLRHCLKQYSLLLEKIPSAILTEETTGTQMFVTGYLSDCIKRCDDGFDDYTMTALCRKGQPLSRCKEMGGRFAVFPPAITANMRHCCRKWQPITFPKPADSSGGIRNRLWENAVSHFSIMRTTECWKRSFSGTIFAG
ncbi:MAG: hypothetical protein ACLUOF_02645 [Ruminococcus sp.]